MNTILIADPSPDYVRTPIGKKLEALGITTRGATDVRHAIEHLSRSESIGERISIIFAATDISDRTSTALWEMTRGMLKTGIKYDPRKLHSKTPFVFLYPARENLKDIQTLIAEKLKMAGIADQYIHFLAKNPGMNIVGRGKSTRFEGVRFPIPDEEGLLNIVRTYITPPGTAYDSGRSEIIET
jgi:hypothetical protein